MDPRDLISKNMTVQDLRKSRLGRHGLRLFNMKFKVPDPDVSYTARYTFLIPKNRIKAARDLANSPISAKAKKNVIQDMSVGRLSYGIERSGNKKIGNIYNSYINREYRGKGLGRTMYGKVFNDMKRDGVYAVTSDYMPSPAALRVWESFNRRGSKVGVFQTHGKRGDIKVYMHLKDLKRT